MRKHILLIAILAGTIVSTGLGVYNKFNSSSTPQQKAQSTGINPSHIVILYQNLFYP